MKSEKAKQYLKNNREEVEINWETGETAWMIWPKDARKAVEIAEQEAEIAKLKICLDESKQREEIARKVIDDKNREIEKLRRL